MRLISAILAKDEAGPDRYLRRILNRCKDFSDDVVVLDDRSTDGTTELAAEFGAIVKVRDTLDARAWGNEGSARAELWEFASTFATEWDDWILVCDADQYLMGDIRGLCLTRECNSIALPLYDLWDSEVTFRSDEFWKAHTVPRLWCFAPNRVPQGWVPEWSTRGVHPGHCPTNWPAVPLTAPPGIHWLHYGWMQPDHRKQKYEQYKSTSHLLSPFERAHVESILS
jgi:glycosyltransferase involved in cell wall biosynthesis